MDANAVAGLSAFAAAAAACLRVSLRRGRSAALWETLAALHAAWALEIVLNLRYRFRAAILPLLQDRGLYGSRTAWQGAAIVVALLIGAALATETVGGTAAEGVISYPPSFFAASQAANALSEIHRPNWLPFSKKPSGLKPT